MEETQRLKKRPLQALKDKPITQDQLAELLDVTPRAINDMRKRGVLPEPSIAYPVGWLDRAGLAAAISKLGVLGRLGADQIERGVL